MTNEQIRKLAESLGGMVRDWMTGPNPLGGDGLDNVIESRLRRELPDNIWPSRDRPEDGTGFDGPTGAE